MQSLKNLGALAIILSMSCGESLPGLPQAALVEPSQIEWQQLEDLQGDAIAAEAFPAGQVARLVLRVLDASLQPVPGALVSLSARADNFDDLLRFPAGTQCFSDAQGLCSIVIASQGKAGALTLTARAAALVPVVAEFPMVVVARRDELKLHVEVQGVGAVEWAGEGTDPLVALERLLINADVNSGRLITVRVNDPHDNPVVGQTTLLALLDQTSAAPDAGAPLPDAAVAAGDASAALPDAATTAGDTSPATPDSGAIVADGGGQADTGATTPAGAKLAIRVSASDDCSELVAPDTPGAGVSDARGNVYYCLYTTAYRGDWRALLRVPGVLDGALDPHGEQGLALDGHSAAGLPTRLAALIDGDKVLCNPGRASPLIRFRVSKDDGEGVPGVRVLFDTVGGLDGLSRRVGATNNQGEVTVKAFCPASRVQGAEVIARVAQPPLDAVHVPIEVRADAVTTLHIEADAGNPAVLHDGDELRFSVSASDANGVQVLHPVGSDEPLSLRFGIASSGHAGTLLLGETPILAQSLAVDEEGLIDLRLTVRSRATMDRPIRLEARTLDGVVRAEEAITVSPGAPSHLAVQPAERVQALVGGVGGTVSIRVLDGDDVNTANGVPGARVQITAPPQLRLDRTVGITDASGLFESVIVLVDRPGDHTLSIAASHGEWSVESQLVVEGTTGVPQSIQVRLSDELLESSGEDGEQAAHEVTLRAGDQLSDVLSLRLTNAQGGGIPGLGLSIERLEGAEDRCATWEEPGVTDEAGEVRYGPGLLTLTGGPLVVRCLYRVRHGATPATALVRVVQITGRPVQASFDPAEVRQLTNFGVRPTQWNDNTSLEVTLRATDANNSPAAQMRMWLEVSNCWVSARDFQLSDDGEKRFRVAGGANINAPCRLSARYSNQLEQFTPPQLELQSGGYATPQLISVHSDGVRDRSPRDSERLVFNTNQASGRWLVQTDLQTIRLTEPVVAGPCPPAECSSLELVRLEHGENDNLIESVDDEGQSLIVRSEIPLEVEFSGNQVSLFVTMDRTWTLPGGWFGLRLRQPGENGAASSAWGFYVHAGFRFAEPRQDRITQLSLLAPEGDEQVTVRSAHQFNLDDDDDNELLVCGTDRQGAWFAVVQLGANGELPNEAVRATRSWLGGDHPTMASKRYVCPVGDVNNDGRLDLIMAMPSQDGMPRVTIHRGIDSDSVFHSEAEVLTWSSQTVRNQNYTMLGDIEGPSGVLIRAGDTRFQLFIDAAQDPMQAADAELFSGDDLALLQSDQPVWAKISGQDSVHIFPDGTLDGCSSYGLQGSFNDRVVVRRQSELLQTYDFVTRRLIHEWQVPGVIRFALASDVDRLMTVDSNGNLKLFNATNGQQIASRQVNRPIESLTQIQLAASGTIGGFVRRNRSGQYPDYELQVRAFDSDFSFSARTGQRSIVFATRPQDPQVIWSRYEFENGADHLRANNRTYPPTWSTIRHIALRNDGELLTHHIGGAFYFYNLTTERGLTEPPNYNGWVSSFGGMGRHILYGKRIYSYVRHQTVRHLPNTGFAYKYVGNSNRWAVQNTPGEKSICALGDPEAPRAFTGSRSGGWLVDGQATSDGKRYVLVVDGNHLRFTRPYSLRLLCGNGRLDPGELFDDETVGLTNPYAASCGASCGNGDWQQGEGCDDGNNEPGDGCDRLCQAE
jgi:cysteine-rich repeat protein